MIIVACVDATEMADEVVAHTIEHARKWEATVHVVHVFQPPTTIYAFDSGFLLEPEEMAVAEHDAVWGRVEPALRSSGVSWERVDLQGHPPSLISAHAEEVGAGMIVVGTRGRGEIAALVLGSTSHGVIHHAPCDVLVVRPG